MSQKFLTVDEAAARLGISSDELMRLMDQRKIFGIKDGPSFKFREEEITRYQAEAGSSSGAYYLPVDESQDEDIGLVTDDLLGSSPSGKGSTIIGPGRGDEPEEEDDSDLKLSDSDVKLIAEGMGDSPSGVKLVPSDSSGKLGGSSSGKMGTGSSGKIGSGSGSGKGETVEIKRGGSSKLTGLPASGSGSGSDLTISESGLSLGEDDDIEIGSSAKGVGSSKLGPGSSKLRLAEDKFDDDDIVLGGSSGPGSGIGDSGINLKPADSGLNLEEPLELGGDDGVSDSSDSSGLSSDDDFLLTPMLELDEQESDSSGSQVIALDTDSETFDDQAATLLGSEPGGFGAAPGAAPMETPMMMVPATSQASFPGWVIGGLVACFMILSLTGMMMFEMIRDIWSWDGPTAASTTIMDGILGLFEDTK